MAPPDVSIVEGRVVGGRLFDQQLQVVLCVANPNRREIALSPVTFQTTIEDNVLAKGVSETPLVLRPLGAVQVPFDVATTTRDLGAPLAAIFTRGSLDYVICGTVILSDFTLIGLPYSIQGHLTPTSVAGNFLELVASRPTTSPCTSSTPRST